MKNTSISQYYYVVQGWMLEELDLSGNELACFAIIYGFSQGLQVCDISLNYFARLLGCSKSSVIRALKNLASKGHIAIINNTSLLSNKKQRNSYQVLRVPGGSNLTLSSGSNLTLQTDFIEILKNNLNKTSKINKSQLLQLKQEICSYLDEEMARLQKIVKTPWIDD